LYSVLADYQGKKWCLASDTVKNIEELRTGEASMTWDDEKSRESIRKIRQIADVVVPGHDRLLEITRRGQAIDVRAVNESALEIIVPWLDKPFAIKV
jgi:hypothetical protein